MSVRLFHNLALALLLVILFAIIFLSYKYAEENSQQLEVIVELHSPSLDNLNSVNDMVRISNFRFELYLSQYRVNKNELIHIMDRLADITERAFSQPQDIKKKLNRFREQLNVYLSSPVNEEISQTSGELKVKLRELKAEYGKLYREIVAIKNSSTVLEQLKIASNLINTFEMRLERYNDEDLVKIDEVIEPLNAVPFVLQSLKSKIQDEVEHHEDWHALEDRSNYNTLVDSIEQLDEFVRRNKKAIEFYSESDRQFDPSILSIIMSREMINEFRDQSNTLVRSVTQKLQTHLKSRESEVLESTLENQRWFIIFAIIGLIMSLVVGIVSRNVILDSVNSLIEGVKKFSLGELDHKVENIKGAEFKKIADAVNEMAIKLRDKEIDFERSMSLVNMAYKEIIQNNEELEEKVEERTSKLENAMKLAKTANRSKSEFLANMSHELRTPMHAILAFSSLGVEKIDTAPKEKLHEYFNDINESGSRLLNLLNDLLDLSKLEARKEKFHLTKQSMGDVIDDVVHELSVLMAGKSIALEVEGSNVSLFAFFDRTKIISVVTNLLSNAIKFTVEGKKISISFSDSELPAGRRSTDSGFVSALTVRVADQGVGIPTDELEIVFDKFLQSSQTSTGAGGTGLGLAICKEIIDGHRGAIWAEHNSFGGTTFIFSIPREKNKKYIK